LVGEPESIDDRRCDVRVFDDYAVQVQQLLQDNIQLVAENAKSDTWFMSATGLIPTMIVLLVSEIVYGPLLEDGIFGFGTVVFNRQIKARFRHTQAEINECFEPPEFTFSDRYASCLKLAAIVLIFSPAAPLLFFIGAAVLGVSFNLQKLALVKFYKRPRAVDAKLAERSRILLVAVLWLKWASACIFLVRQAHVASEASGIPVDYWDTVPLICSFFLLLSYLVYELVAEWCCTPDLQSNEVGKDREPMLYQQACDEVPGFLPYRPDRTVVVKPVTVASRRWQTAAMLFKRGLRVGKVGAGVAAAAIISPDAAQTPPLL